MTSIYAHLLAHVPADGGPGLTDGGERLPDEPEPDAGGLRWAPGALDGVMGHHAGSGDAAVRVTEVADLLERASSGWRAGRARRRLYDVLRAGDVLGIVDDVLDRLRDDPTRHHAVAEWLVRESADREPVKFGMALLGLGVTEEDRQVLRVLGRHEEFTLYAAVALARTSADPEGELWGLARNVEGWGRIHIVERLAGTERPDIKDWLVRGGFRNNVMNEYTAFTAATTGDLVSALEGPVDDELMNAAVDILAALIAGGPAEDISHYAEAPTALRRVLALVAMHPRTAEQGLLVVETERLVNDEERVPHWTPEVRAELAATCRRVLTDPAWTGVVERGLVGDATFWAADQLAQALGIDSFPAILERLAENPFHAAWWQAMQRVDEARLPDLLALADRHFDPAELGSGPADDLGLGPEYRRHAALEQLVTGLAGFPGQGWRHVRTALASPVVRTRNMALRTLDAWGRAAWPAETGAVLEEAAAREPRDDVRASIERLLAGRPIDER